MTPEINQAFIDQYSSLITDNICATHAVDPKDPQARAILAYNISNPDNPINLNNNDNYSDLDDYAASHNMTRDQAIYLLNDIADRSIKDKYSELIAIDVLHSQLNYTPDSVKAQLQLIGHAAGWIDKIRVYSTTTQFKDFKCFGGKSGTNVLDVYPGENIVLYTHDYTCEWNYQDTKRNNHILGKGIAVYITVPNDAEGLTVLDVNYGENSLLLGYASGYTKGWIKNSVCYPILAPYLKLVIKNPQDINSVKVLSSLNEKRVYANTNKSDTWCPIIDLMPKEIITFEHKSFKCQWSYYTLNNESSDRPKCSSIGIKVPVSATGLAVLVLDTYRDLVYLDYNNDATTGWIKSEECYPTE